MHLSCVFHGATAVFMYLSYMFQVATAFLCTFPVAPFLYVSYCNCFFTHLSCSPFLYALFIHLSCMVAHWNCCLYAPFLYLSCCNCCFVSFSSRPIDPEFLTGWPERWLFLTGTHLRKQAVHVAITPIQLLCKEPTSECMRMGSILVIVFRPLLATGSSPEAQNK